MLRIRRTNVAASQTHGQCIVTVLSLSILPVRSMPPIPGSEGSDESSDLVSGYADAPGHLLRRAQQAHTQLWAEGVPVDVTSSQYSILAALSVHGDLDQAAVGRLLSLDKSSVAELASRMERRGLIQRSRDDRDARRQVLRITEEGGRTVTEAAPYVHQVGQQLLAQLEAVERAPFISCLKRVGDAAIRGDLRRRRG
jgi:MarR family transcriptional regulator, temperature-dependent positive regulator of motility